MGRLVSRHPPTFVSVTMHLIQSQWWSSAWIYVFRTALPISLGSYRFSTLNHSIWTQTARFMDARQFIESVNANGRDRDLLKKRSAEALRFERGAR